jgi:hypothetical protein
MLRLTSARLDYVVDTKARLGSGICLGRRLILLASLFSLSLVIFTPTPSHAQNDVPPGARIIYNPFPLQYDMYLVKVLDGLEPGKSTLRDAVDRYGEPHLISKNTYFYWEWQVPESARQIRISFFPPKGKMKPGYNICGFDGRAVIKEIRCYDARRMGKSTFLGDMVNFTPFPYELKYYGPENRYEMCFYEQGYSMFFDGDTEQFLFERYFPHEDLVIRGVYYFKTGTGDFLYVEDDYLY